MEVEGILGIDIETSIMARIKIHIDLEEPDASTFDGTNY